MQYLAQSECFIRGGYYYGAAYYVHITVWSAGTNKKGKKQWFALKMHPVSMDSQEKYICRKIK